MMFDKCTTISPQISPQVSPQFVCVQHALRQKTGENANERPHVCFGGCFSARSRSGGASFPRLAWSAWPLIKLLKPKGDKQAPCPLPPPPSFFPALRSYIILAYLVSYLIISYIIPGSISYLSYLILPYRILSCLLDSPIECTRPPGFRSCRSLPPRTRACDFSRPKATELGPRSPRAPCPALSPSRSRQSSVCMRAVVCRFCVSANNRSA